MTVFKCTMCIHVRKLFNEFPCNQCSETNPIINSVNHYKKYEVKI